MEYSPPGRGGQGPPYSTTQTSSDRRNMIRSPTDSSDSRRQQMGVGVDDSISPSSPSPSMVSSSSTQSNDPSHTTSASTGTISKHCRMAFSFTVIDDAVILWNK